MPLVKTPSLSEILPTRWAASRMRSRLTLGSASMTLRTAGSGEGQSVVRVERDTRNLTSREYSATTNSSPDTAVGDQTNACVLR